MNPIDSKTLERANEAAIYNIYLYLAHKTTPADGESLRAVTAALELAFRIGSNWNERDIHRLNILKNAVLRSPPLANSKISNLTRSIRGLAACTFTNPKGNIYVVFRGTGKGEWIDNGEGLSGIPGENTYITYGKGGRIISLETVKMDYATNQQAEALNWFNNIVAKNGWNEDTEITLCGHSKGGNKAQFIAIHSNLAADCYSFDGQGFSPEALTALKNQYRATFETRRQKIHSFSADNDYVNVLGERLMPENQIYNFKSSMGFHYMESMLDESGRFNSQSEQGKLSRYIETVSKDLMSMPPFIRRYATRGVMNIFQKFWGKDTPVNQNFVSIEETVAGIAVAVSALLHNLPDAKDSRPPNI